MKLTQYKSTSTSLLNMGFASIAAKLTFILATTAYAATALAGAPTSDTSTAYVDSIHQWGAWELDIEPAAGGLQQPSTQALNARETNVSLRANSINALRANGVATLSDTTRATPAIPAVPAVPATPAAPAIPARPAPSGTIAPPGSTPTIVVTLPAS